MTRRLAFRLLLALTVLVPACRSEKQTHAHASPSARPLASVNGAPADQPLDTPPQYRIFHVFPKNVAAFSVGSRLVACEACIRIQWTRRPVPRTWLIDTEHVTEDTSLLPRVTNIHEPSVRYVGRYPNEVFAVVRFGYDENTTDEAYLYLGHGTGARFAPAPRPDDYRALGGFKPSPKCVAHCEPFEIYLAGAAPPPPTAMLFGQGGPLLVIDTRKIALWNGASWIHSAAPWGSVIRDNAAVRLSNGSSLVDSASDSDYDPEPARDLFWVSASGKIRWVDIATPGIQAKLGELHFREPIELNGEIWLLADANAGTVLLAPVKPSEARRAATEN
jgi:hypothetical protein